MMALSGVRSSWLMLARNCDLCCRLRELATFVLNFLKQSYVLDGDCRLVGESLDQHDLLVGKRFDLEPLDRDGAHQHIVLEHRDRQCSSDRVHIADDVAVFGVSLNVGKLDRSALKRGAA